MTNILKNSDEKYRGGRVGDSSIFNFFMLLARQKCHFKRLHFGQVFLFVFVKFPNSLTSLLA